MTYPVGSGGGVTVPGDPGTPTVPGDDPDVPGVEPDEPGSGDSGDDDESGAGDVYFTGGIECTRVNDNEPVCWGEIYACDGFESGCTPVDPDTIETEQWCDTSDYMRYWRQYQLHALDLADPTDPTLHEPYILSPEDDGVSTLAAGSDVYYVFRREFAIEGDVRPYVRYFFERVDLSDPASPTSHAAVNIPGVLLAVEGETLYTRDFVYADDRIEGAISRLRLEGDLAYLQARHRFEGREVENMLLDDAGQALVSHHRSWAWSDGWDASAEPHELSVLDDESLEEMSAVEVADWASLEHALPGRALLSVPGGLLVMNIDDPEAVYPQAWFATLGWPRDIRLHARDVMFAAGRYGIYAFDLDTFALPSRGE